MLAGRLILVSGSVNLLRVCLLKNDSGNAARLVQRLTDKRRADGTVRGIGGRERGRTCGAPTNGGGIIQTRKVGSHRLLRKLALMKCTPNLL